VFTLKEPHELKQAVKFRLV